MALTALATAAVVGTGYSIYSGEQGRAAQREAQQNAQLQAKKQERASEEAYNAANKKQPNIPGTLAAASSMADQGVGSTMLTGPGADIPTGGAGSLLGAAQTPGNLSMKKNSLLGG